MINELTIKQLHDGENVFRVVQKIPTSSIERKQKARNKITACLTSDGKMDFSTYVEAARQN